MNLFRLAGDMSHLASFLVLLLKLLASRSAAGACAGRCVRVSRSRGVVSRSSLVNPLCMQAFR